MLKEKDARFVALSQFTIANGMHATGALPFGQSGHQRTPSRSGKFTLAILNAVWLTHNI
jgi:hypothetical protein